MTSQLSIPVLLENLESLPTLPEVALQILKISSNPEAEIEDFHEIISRDASLTAKILRTANSAYYGLRSQVSSLKMALVMLGLEETAQLSRAFTFLQAFPSSLANSRFDYNRYWLHNITVSEVARGIGHRLGRKDTSELATGGLLHDMGLLVLASFFEEEFVKVVNLVIESGNELRVVEQNVYGTSHPEVGEILAKKWNLPPQLAAMIRYHHEPQLADEEYRDEVMLTYLANRVSQHYEVGVILEDHIPVRVEDDPIWEQVISKSSINPKPSPSQLVELAKEDIENAQQFHALNFSNGS